LLVEWKKILAGWCFWGLDWKTNRWLSECSFKAFSSFRLPL